MAASIEEQQDHQLDAERAVKALRAIKEDSSCLQAARSLSE